MKVAKLVQVSFMTRVIVEEDATDEQILEIAKPKFSLKVQTELSDNLEVIMHDDEMPYGEGSDMYTVTDIKWDTDGEEIDLPQEITVYVPETVEENREIEDYISDKITERTGFCHKGFSITKE